MNRIFCFFSPNTLKKPYIIIPSILFLIVLLLIHPIMFFNDEWITGNQLNQLSHGSQILYNEGKYGTFENGTPYAYFEIRKNTLPYTSYLPILSLPFLWMVMISSGNLPYFLLIIWITFAFFLLLIMKNRYFNDKQSFFLIISIFLFFFLNILFYNQLSTTNKTDSTEILAVVLYHVCILTAYSGIIYLINKIIFPQPIKAVFGTITTICCSSAIFWATTMKDHLDIMFFIGLLIYSILLQLKTKDPWFAITTFIISGLIIWIRPEYGVFISLSLLITYIPLILLFNGKINKQTVWFIFISPIFVFFGSIPLLINNYLVMGNPLKIPWQIYSGYKIIPDNDISQNLLLTSNSDIIEKISHIFYNILMIFFQRLNTEGDPFNGIFSAFFFPETLKLPIFAITPIFLLTIFLLPILILCIKTKIEPSELQFIFILGTLSLTTIIAYFTSITSLGTSIGIYPDVRYLSPLYLPLTLIGLIVLMKFDIPDLLLQKISRNILIIALLGIVVVLTLTTCLHNYYNYSDFFLWLNVFTASMIFITLGLSLVSFYLKVIGIKTQNIQIITLSFLIALPLIWQFSQLIIINFSNNLFDQYPPLLPAIRVFFEYISSNSMG